MTGCSGMRFSNHPLPRPCPSVRGRAFTPNRMPVSPCPSTYYRVSTASSVRTTPVSDVRKENCGWAGPLMTPPCKRIRAVSWPMAKKSVSSCRESMRSPRMSVRPLMPRAGVEPKPKRNCLKRICLVIVL